MSEAVTWTLAIPGWHPAPINQLLKGRWTASKLKDRDRQMIGTAVLAGGIPRATGQRRVRLLVVWPAGQRSVDKDALYKSLLDALVHSGALKNDSAAWCEPERPRYARGEELITFITLEDLW